MVFIRRRRLQRLPSRRTAGTTWGQELAAAAMAGQDNREMWWAELTQRAQQLGREEEHILPLAGRLVALQLPAASLHDNCHLVTLNELLSGIVWGHASS